MSPQHPEGLRKALPSVTLGSTPLNCRDFSPKATFLCWVYYNFQFHSEINMIKQVNFILKY